MQIVGSLLIGLVVGLAGRVLAPGSGRDGFVRTAALGVAGSLVAAYAGDVLGWYRPGEAAGMMGSLVGAIVAVVVYRLFSEPPAY